MMREKEDLLEELKMVEDDRTAYDEVINDVQALCYKYVGDSKAYLLIAKKLEQLMRLLGDEASWSE